MVVDEESNTEEVIAEESWETRIKMALSSLRSKSPGNHFSHSHH